jgi:hypothetical protein
LGGLWDDIITKGPNERMNGVNGRKKDKGKYQGPKDIITGDHGTPFKRDRNFAQPKQTSQPLNDHI